MQATQPKSQTQRRGHPQRSGQQQVVREAVWKILDYIQKTGNPGLYKEIADTLEDELVARGSAGRNAGLAGVVINASPILTDGRPPLGADGPPILVRWFDRIGNMACQRIDA